jgi:hypothetical protein
MDLVREIVEILSDTHPNLENALIKTKVLLHRLGEKVYADWINKELNGYSNDDQVPAYRVIQSSVKITVTDGYTRWNDMPAAIRHLDEKIRFSLERNDLRQGISTLESLAHSEGNTLNRAIPPEMWGMLGEKLSSDIVVEYAQCEISKAQLQGILTQIRSRLLDFVLELEAKLPSNASEEDIRRVFKEVHVGNLLNNAMFGPNTTIVIGDNNKQNLNFSVVQKGDFTSLATLLKSRCVADADISSLKTAIDEDGPHVDHQRRQYGPRVRAWLKDMLGKAVETSWQIEVGVASSLLATALNHYYGWF